MRIWGWKRVKIVLNYKTSNQIVEKTILKEFSKSRFWAIFWYFYSLGAPFWPHYGYLKGEFKVFQPHDFRSSLHVVLWKSNMVPQTKPWYPTDHGVPRMVPRGSQCDSCCHNENTIKSAFLTILIPPPINDPQRWKRDLSKILSRIVWHVLTLKYVFFFKKNGSFRFWRQYSSKRRNKRIWRYFHYGNNSHTESPWVLYGVPRDLWGTTFLCGVPCCLVRQCADICRNRLLRVSGVLAIWN